MIWKLRMKETAVRDLPADTELSRYICHKSGEVLHSPGEHFTRSHRALMHQCEIETVILAESAEEVAAIKQAGERQTVLIEDIPVDEPVPVTLYKNGTTPVVEAGGVFTGVLLEELAAEDVESLSFNKDPMERNVFQCRNYAELLRSDKIDSLESVADPDEILYGKKTDEGDATEKNEGPLLPEVSIPDDRFLHHPSKEITHIHCKQLMKQADVLRITAGKPDYRLPVKILEERDTAVKESFNALYMEWLTQLEEIFTNLKSNKEVVFEAIDGIARSIIECYFRDCLYSLNMINARHPPVSEKYLLMHGVNVALVVTGVGVYLGFPLAMIRELTISGLLHDVGHLVTFRPLLAKKELDSTEQQRYDQHSIVGMAMLKNITRVPISTMLAVSQHHEFCNGTGRIYHARKDELHDFSRIIAVVDTVETLCRFYNASAAVALAVHRAQSGELDIDYVKAMLAVLSLFPVGTSLHLDNGYVGKVVSVYANSFKTPVVRTIFKMSDGHLFPIDAGETIDLKKNGKIKIVEEIDHSALKSDISIGF